MPVLRSIVADEAVDRAFGQIFPRGVGKGQCRSVAIAHYDTADGIARRIGRCECEAGR